MSDYWRARLELAIVDIRAALASNGDVPSAIAHLVDAQDNIGHALTALAEQD